MHGILSGFSQRLMAALSSNKDALIEALAFLVLGAGVYLGLAMLSFNPFDIANMAKGGSVQNLAGPLGAVIAAKFFHMFGLAAIAFPFLMTFWASAMLLGLVTAPTLQRVLGAFLLICFGAALLEVQLRMFGFTVPSFSFGGLMGRKIAFPMLRVMSYHGATIILMSLALGSLVLSGNVSVARLRSLLRFAFVRVQTLGKRAVTLVVNAEKEMTDVELIKMALRDELKSSKSLQNRAGSANSKEKESEESLQNLARSQSEDAALAGFDAGLKKKLKKSSPSSDLDLRDLAAEALSDADEDASEASVSSSSQLDFYYNGPNHGRPEAGMFSRSSKAKDRSSEFSKMAAKLTNQLLQFKVEGKIKNITEGPVVTTFEYEPVPGTKVSKITSLAQDLARLLEASSLRILAPIPGKKTVGFEVPNKERRMIGFADLIERRELRSGKIALPIAMGLDTFGNPVIEDLAKMPHLLVAGSTGSGKSVFMNTLIGSLIARHTAKDLRFVMIDPKMVELAAYNALPHMACPVVTDPQVDAKEKLDALVYEMDQRFHRMRQVGARNIDGFNEVIAKKKKTDFPEFEGRWQKFPYIVLIIDELADMMMQLGKEAEIPITRLAQKARAAGIHLVIATQRPSADVVTGLIKANFPTRVAFRVLSGLDSRTILDQSGAEVLIGQGDMLFLNASGLNRMHGAYLSDSEVQKMVRAAK